MRRLHNRPPEPNRRVGAGGQVCHIKGNVAAEPAASDIIGRSAGEPTVLVIVGRSRLAENLPAVKAAAGAGTADGGDLQHLVHDEGGLGADRLGRFPVILQNIFPVLILDDGIEGRRIVPAAVSEGRVGGGLLGGGQAVGRSAQSQLGQADIRVGFAVDDFLPNQRRDPEAVGHEVKELLRIVVFLIHAGRYQVIRPLDGVLDGLFSADIAARVLILHAAYRQRRVLKHGGPGDNVILQGGRVNPDGLHRGAGLTGRGCRAVQLQLAGLDAAAAADGDHMTLIVHDGDGALRLLIRAVNLGPILVVGENLFSR